MPLDGGAVIVGLYPSMCRVRLMMLTRFLAAALFILPVIVTAQEQGEVQQGRVYAEQVCAECHMVGPEGGMSENVDA